MKNLVQLILSCALSTSLFSQGNLQFNQIRKIDISGSQSYSYNYSNGNSQMNFAMQTIIVPTGKVLKIESSFVRMIYSGTNNEAKALTGTNGSTNNIDVLLMFLDNNIIAHQAGANNEFKNLRYQYPIWLPAGSYQLKLIGDCSTNGPTTTANANGMISAIEFNIVP